MAKQAEGGSSVLDLQCSAAALEAQERRQKKHCILLKLSRSTYFLVKDRIPHMTTFPQLIQLQGAIGDKALEQHINESPSNAKYTSTFSIAAMIEAIDTWLESSDD